MSSKVRLWVNLTAIVVVFAVIVMAISAIFSKASRFLDMPGIDNQVKYYNLEIAAKINDESFFKVSYVNGEKVQDINEIQPEHSRFTMENKVLTYAFEFENKSTRELFVKIEGIYIDRAERFATTATMSNNQGTGYTYKLVEEGSTGSIYFSLDPLQEGKTPNLEDGSKAQVNLIYTLNEFHRNIKDAKQNLKIIINTESLQGQ